MIDKVRLVPKLPLSTNIYLKKNIRRIDYIENEKLAKRVSVLTNIFFFVAVEEAK
jgi:hypothetical protein